MFEGLRTTLDEIRQGQRELSGSHTELIQALALLRAEFLRADLETRDDVQHALDAVTARVEQLARAFHDLHSKLFGLPLVRLGVAPRPENRDLLWLLRAKCRALELVGREQELESLWTWVNSDAQISVRLLTGPAGTGKTRLGYELLWRLAAQHGREWDAGLIENSHLRTFSSQTQPVDWAWTKPTLLVIDDARAAGDALTVLLRELARRVGNDECPRFRLLLLERDARVERSRLVATGRVQSATDDWLRGLLRIESDHGGVPAAQIFDPPAPVELLPLETFAQRRGLFQAALAALKSPLALNVPLMGVDAPFDALLGQSDWAIPLVPVMAALVADSEGRLMAASRLTRANLAEQLASDEARRLVAFAARSGASAESENELLIHVAGLTVLCGLTTRKDIRELARVEARALATNWSGGVGSLANVLSDAWAAPGGAIAKLQPDIVAEAFVLESLATVRTDERTDAILRHYVGREPIVVDLTIRALQNFKSDRRSSILEAIVQQLAVHAIAQRDSALIAALDAAMPTGPIGLRTTAALLTEARFAAADPKSSARCSLAHNLAIRYRDLGRHDDALPFAEEAVKLARELVARDANEFTPDLAVALHLVSGCYAYLGRLSEALMPAQEATAIGRRLMDGNAPTFTVRDFARSLQSLASRYAAVGNHKDALDLTTEAVELLGRAAPLDVPENKAELAHALQSRAGHVARLAQHREALDLATAALRLFRELAAYRPDPFAADLADCLDRVAAHLAKVGRYDEAIAAAKESLAIWREFVAVEAETFSENLAHSLKTLANQYANAGRPAEALQPAAEAVELCRRLFARSSLAFAIDLADALVAFANHHARVGAHVDALTPAEEAVALYRDLAAQSPEAFTAGLASSLGDLAIHYGNLDRHEEAIGLTEESVSLDRWLVSKSPDAFKSDLAHSLQNLAAQYVVVGRRRDAFASTAEAAALYHDLRAISPDAFTLDLARTLEALSSHADELGQDTLAIDALSDSVRLYREMVDRTDRFSMDLARTVRRLAKYFAHSQQYDAAIQGGVEAVALYRALAPGSELFSAELAASLNDLGICYAMSERHEEALAPMSEAVERYRALASVSADRFAGDLAGSLFNLARSHGDLGQLDHVLEPLVDSIRAWRSILATTKERSTIQRRLLHAYNWLGSFADGGDPSAASAFEREYLEQLSLCEENHGGTVAFHELLEAGSKRTGGWELPPLVDGAWQTIEGRAFVSLASRIVALSALPEIPIAARQLELPCYARTAHLVEVAVDRGGRRALVSAIVTSRQLAILDGTAESVFAANRAIEVRLADVASAEIYLRLYSAHVRGEHPFLVLRKIQDLRWRTPPEPTLISAITPSFVMFRGEPPRAAGSGFLVHATVLYGSALHACAFTIQHNGVVTMESSHLGNVDVVQDDFEGIYRMRRSE